MVLNQYYKTTALLLPFLLYACSATSVFDTKDGGPDRYVDVSTIPDAVPKVEPRSRYGNPASYAVFGKRYYVMNSSENYVERGIASWYGTKFHGERTSSGEAYDMYAMTAAHKSLPLPTYVQVRNLQNDRSVIVKVNDRGPIVNNRIIDLSYSAAKKLGITGNGTGMVEVRAINPQKPVSKPVVASTTVPASQESINQAQLYLQVGAFQSRQNAERLRTRLGDLVISDIGILDGYEKQKLIYRVRIGPLASVDEADRMADKLSTYGFSDSRIIID